MFILISIGTHAESWINVFPQVPSPEDKVPMDSWLDEALGDSTSQDDLLASSTSQEKASAKTLGFTELGLQIWFPFEQNSPIGSPEKLSAYPFEDMSGTQSLSDVSTPCDPELGPNEEAAYLLLHLSRARSPEEASKPEQPGLRTDNDPLLFTITNTPFNSPVDAAVSGKAAKSTLTWGIRENETCSTTGPSESGEIDCQGPICSAIRGVDGKRSKDEERCVRKKQRYV